MLLIIIKMLDDFGRNSTHQGVGRYVACHNSPGGYHGLVPYGDAVDDCHIGHYPHSTANVDGFDGERVDFLQRSLCRDTTVGGDGAAVANGGIVAYGDLFREGPVENHVMANVDTLADVDAAPAVHFGSPPFERDKESKAGEAEAPELDEGVF